ncbi:sugar ABC transporter substrate-binding protein [Paenibacillus sp. J31TS4]|uniref:extracellular solute-binding protein n=1 Tax=Paenibacillus sp. J31TS4 TaxID=2807195 RepID=UPI001B290378|nr:extracellular solute-binding protein [Paenibacillus sp. J31TS4]GIP37677.1 sugar ABC transporter substrate-binding protein [Paenibacillus sp. J31TS4]
MKKTVTVLSIAALAATAAGCGGGSDAGSSSSPAPSSATAATSGPKPELRQLNQFDRYDATKEAPAKWITERTGYTVKYDLLPAENADEKLNLLMANKEPYDLMKLNKNQFSKLVSSGALEPLDDLIAKYGKNLKQAIAPESWEAVKVNGKIYAIPEASSGNLVNFELAVRQDILDELGLKVPTTRDELYTVLKTIKEKKGIIPLTGGKDPFIGDIASTFGLSTQWEDNGGTLRNYVENPAMKEYLTFMNKLYKEGLMDPEWGINTGAKAIEKLSSGKAAMYRVAYYDGGNLNNALLKNFPNAKMTLIPFLKDANGKNKVVATTGVSWFISIPKFAPHKDDALKLIDAKLEKDTFKGLAIGQEGVHHEVKDGKYYPIQPKFADEWANASAFVTGVDQNVYPTYWQARVRKDPYVQSYFETIQENAKPALVIDPLTFAPPLDNISKNSQKLAKLVEDSFLKFISGSEPMSNYDAFVANWKAQGGDEMTKEANDWYKANKK